MALKRIELANPNGCLNQAKDDEPIFVLRANDELASSTVRVWAECYLARKRAVYEAQGEPLPQRVMDKYLEALANAQLMDEWRIEKLRAAKREYSGCLYNKFAPEWAGDGPGKKIT